ncbi:MAG: UDP-N-acetylmuramoyl-L-alanine--D-glutamate ligase, partial [Rhodothermales bacterium]|nr:UDP-N-acetylmuramoyl-L-alanine--D-glutamate ligase [Rhodothermales bacterium]
IVGAGRSGIAVARLLSGKNAEVFLTDNGPIDAAAQATLTELNIPFEYDGHSPRAIAADWIVISPGVPTEAPIIRQALDQGIPVVSEIEVAFWYCRAPIIAITGSNGKTTTASLAAHFIRASGRTTHLVGNIGLAFSDVVDSVASTDAVVLEVSSFQLDHVSTFRPGVSVLLNITPDHLSRYQNSFEAYKRSKLRIFENQRLGDVAVLNVDDEVTRDSAKSVPDQVRRLDISLSREVPSGAFLRDDEIILRYDKKEEILMHRQEVSVRGRHNLYNTLAAAVAARIMEVRSDVIRESMATFQGVPHRLELVREIGGVQFFNDSKATNVNAVWYALESFSERIILIAGGRDKGNDYEPLRELVRKKVGTILAIGEAADTILETLGGETQTAVKLDSLRDAVDRSRLLAKPGEVVLLSPACASFDQFDNYEDRGDSFKRYVAEL